MRKTSNHGKNYFNSPEEAVEKIRNFLVNEEFLTLSSYYDLSGTNITRSSLNSGDFFIRKDRPDNTHPGDFWRYKHPFSPAFDFAYIQSTHKTNIYRVTMTISIDQGEDVPIQEGFSFFYMIKSKKGWQVLAIQELE